MPYIIILVLVIAIVVVAVRKQKFNQKQEQASSEFNSIREQQKNSSIEVNDYTEINNNN